MIDGSFRTRLKSGEPLLGAFINIESPTTVEMLAVAGMDFLMIDGEHGPIGPADAVEMIRAAEARGVPILARVGENTQQVMAKYLDAGAVGTMTPIVGSADDARRAVDSVKYPPVGKRGLAGVRANDFQTDPGYVAAANEATVVVVQIETRTGIERADEIIATEGVDLVFLGPSDLSVALGVPGETKHPLVLDNHCQTDREDCRGRQGGGHDRAITRRLRVLAPARDTGVPDQRGRVADRCGGGVFAGSTCLGCGSLRDTLEQPLYRLCRPVDSIDDGRLPRVLRDGPGWGIAVLLVRFRLSCRRILVDCEARPK